MKNATQLVAYGLMLLAGLAGLVLTTCGSLLLGVNSSRLFVLVFLPLAFGFIVMIVSAARKIQDRGRSDDA